MLKSLRLRYGVRGAVPLALLAALWAASVAPAQEMRGTVLGRVVDQSGATVPGARVVVMNQATNVASDVTTNMEGNYVVPFLLPGQYSVTVQKEGFSKAVRENNVLQTQDRLTLDFVLKPGRVAETITVSAESPILQTASADFGQVVDNSFINRLPVAGLSPLMLADTAPGVMLSTTPDYGDVSNYYTSYLQINGSAGPGNQITIDGAPSEVPRMGGVSYVIPMSEMVGELKIVTAMFDASHGRTNGGSILISTKTGTNRFHGNGYYHIRDERFNANSWSNNYFSQPRGQLNFWVAGGGLSGPVIRDRTFFTVGLEKQRKLSASNFRYRVPTAFERQGDFSQTLNNLAQPLVVYDPLSTKLDANGKFVSRAPFPGARIPADRINTVGAAIASQYPDANYVIPLNQFGQVNYLTSANQGNPVLNLQTRVDHTLNDKHRLYVRWARSRGIVGGWDHSPTPGSATLNTDNRFANQWVVEETATLGPALVMTSRIGFDRFNQLTSGPGDKLDPNALKLPDVLKSVLYSGGDQQLGWPRIDVNDGSMPSMGPLFRQSVNNVLTAANSYNKFWRSHNLRWGVDYRNTRWFDNNPGSSQNGAFSFDKLLTRASDDAATSTTSGSGLASLLLGLPTGGSVARNPALAVQSHYLGAYLQDDFRITAKLTLSLGLRYDIETPLTERYDRFAYDFAPDADLGLTVPGIGALKGGLRFVNTNGLPRRQGRVDTNNFGPRLAIAYQPNSKTVVRAGWGLFYEGLINNLTASVPTSVSTYAFSTAYSGSSDGYKTVLPNVNLSNPFPNGFNPITGNSLGAKTLLGQGVTFLKPDARVPSIQQMQFSVQRQLPWTSMFDAAYVGIRSDNLYKNYNLNEVPDAYRTQDNAAPNPFYGILPATTSLGAGSTITAYQTRLAYPQFTGVNMQNANGSWARYHALQTRWEKRMSHGMQVMGNYTYSKNLMFDPQSVVNDRFYKYVSGNDYAHTFRLFFTADLPFGKGRAWGTNWARWLDEVAGGWSLTWITRYTSGAALGLSGPNGRPIPLGNLVTGAGIHACLGTPATALPASPCLNISNVLPLVKYQITPEPPQYSWLRGPGYMEQDAVFFKRFRIVERLGFELRAEAYNVLNTPQWSSPSTNISNPRTFGQILGGGNPRQLRLMGKLEF